MAHPGPPERGGFRRLSPKCEKIIVDVLAGLVLVLGKAGKQL